jgi:hypothetical protein
LSLIVLLLLLTATGSMAQNKKSKAPHSRLKQSIAKKGYDSGAGLGTYSFNFGSSTYYGDLCDDYSCMIFRPNFGIGYSYRYDKNFSFRAESNFYMLKSRDVYKYRDFSFKSANVELYVGAIYDLFDYSKRFKKRRLFTPYLFGGIGLTYFNPRAQYQGKYYSLEPLHTEGHGYSRVTPILPFGVGVRMKFGKGFDGIAEAGYRKTFTDYMDDVSAHYYQPIASFSNPVAAALSNKTAAKDAYQGYRGNPHKKDGYFIFQLKVCYTPKLTQTTVPRYRHTTGSKTQFFMN